MKRSIGAPLILMAVGVLFLLNNFYPDVFTFHSLFRMWPFLLIGIGVIRLIEVLVEAGQSRPLAPSNFSFAGIIVLVLLCLLFWGVSKGTRAAWHGFPAYHFNWNSMGDEFDYDVQQSLPASAADTRLVLGGLRGSVTISGDDSDTVSVTGHRAIHAFGQGAANEANRRTRIELVRDGKDIILRSAGSSELKSSYEIDVKVPRRMSVSNQASLEDVTVESLDGGVDISSDTGNVRLTSIGGDVRVETTRRKDLVRVVGVKGKLDLRGTGNDVQLEDIEGQVAIQGNYFGTLDFHNLAKPLHFESEQTDLRVEKLPGTLSMDLGDFRADNVVGPLRLKCESRDVHISNFSNELEVSVQRGDIDLNPEHTPLSKIDVHVHAGDIQVTLPEKALFELHATTSQGDTDNQFGNGIAASSEGRSAWMKSASSGGVPINLTTGRGDIAVKKQ